MLNAEMLKMTDQAIALAFRIPMQILGVTNTTFASTEVLMQSWIASGLGFTLNHIEEALGLLFGLKGVPDEYLELNTKALLRSAYRERIEALARGVISGIYSPDEARAEEDLPRVPGGYGAQRGSNRPPLTWRGLPAASPHRAGTPAAARQSARWVADATQPTQIVSAIRSGLRLHAA
jgi:hypothetical protein